MVPGVIIVGSHRMARMLAPSYIMRRPGLTKRLVMFRSVRGACFAVLQFLVLAAVGGVLGGCGGIGGWEGCAIDSEALGIFAESCSC